MGDVVVTGIGVVSPIGLSAEDYWAAAMSGRSGIRPIRRFATAGLPARLAGEVEGFAPRDHLPARLLPQTDLMTQYALYAADRALAEAGPPPGSPLDAGVVTAAASGGFGFGQRELQHLWGEGPGHVSAFMSFAWFYAVNTGQISIRHDLRGPVGVMVTEQAGGLDAIAHARRKVAGGARMMVTGGMDASLCPYGMAAQLRSGRLSRGTDPATAYLPFDRRAQGHVPGEGGALLTLEDGEAARARGARVYGRIAGHGAAFDPPAGSGRPSTLVRAVEAALADAGAEPADVAVVFADAAADPGLDEAEAEALTAVFGPRGVPVTAPKTLTGRLYSGAAPLDVVAALFALDVGVAPVTANVADVDPESPLDLVLGRPRPVTGNAALVVARGAGGFNSAMVVRR
ncbi:ketosynthase chain-length factor [Microbispora sp. RL4-1S]|uniref:Ketosynthase chain-length factor n=1 Tax=Microbispora oryzae TaxID=2806554 RepID=A0A941AHP7_9ACTN|nr:ketosynthase chain-length factor [Microbispora oryzae]MBP2702957.1 ketosynthase chain-length factor [Microbispora oryzae]